MIHTVNFTVDVRFPSCACRSLLKEFYSIIQERAVAYINADVSFQANVYFKALATPVLQELVYDVTQMIPDHEDRSLFLELYLPECSFRR